MSRNIDTSNNDWPTAIVLVSLVLAVAFKLYLNHKENMFEIQTKPKTFETTDSTSLSYLWQDNLVTF